MGKIQRLHKSTRGRLPLFAFTGALLFILSACSAPTTVEPGADAKTEGSAAWPVSLDPEAQAYLAQCEQEFNQAKAQFDAFESRQTPYETQELLSDINAMDITLDGTLSRTSLYSNVHPNAEVRTAAQSCQQKFVALLGEISLSRPLFNHLEKVDTTGLNAIDKRYVEKMLRDYRRSGVDKDDATRKRIKELIEETNLIGQNFGKTILEDTRVMEVDSAAGLAGMPEDFIAARKTNDAGKLLVSTDYPDYVPFMQYAHNDELRYELYKIFRQRAYPANKEVLLDLVRKRHELAQLLGYKNYAQYVTEVLMIESPENAQEFIDRVYALATPRAQAEYKDLLVRLQQDTPSAKVVTDWQKIYIEQLVKKEKYEIDSQVIRQYFQYDNVRQGIFDLTEAMFGVTIQPWDGATWHESVRGYEVVDSGKVIGRFYLDMHPREGKYKHAAAFSLQDGVRDIQLPIYALVCNFPGGDGTAGLMEHSDVETFLHEFGHLLHGIFGGNQPWLSMSGIRTEWDFVEAPSQMLEEWVWDMDTLATFARNDKGEVIPQKLVDKMIAGRDFGRGLWTQHQLFYAALSLNVYNRDPAELDLDKLTAEIQAEYSPFGYVDDTYFYASFGHLNGYSAIYYTYMWSLVISADMFSEFQQNGLRNTEVAQRYRRYVMDPGGSKDAADLVKDFLGRPYSFEAFANDLNHDVK
jgi:thimet oligopeptidase